MFEVFAALVLGGHFLLVGLLCVYGVHRLHLTLRALRAAALPQAPAALLPAELPLITVQLPVYNEQFVVERLIDAAAALDYPADRLQIQLLDDSTDASAALAAARCAEHRARGVWIEHRRRRRRGGYKAGALAAALPAARGEFIAIFDADFVPHPGFLREALAAFADPAIGLVQSRWTHLNRGYSTLTAVQAIMLDAHFAIDQRARAANGCFFNFNGTAGVWRRQAIDDAGGWQADTITEDLDLSYRAQLAGWRFAYLNHVECLSELPVAMNAFKSQQHRWAKGAIQVMRKLLPRIWRAPIGWRLKLEASLHLSSNFAYLFMLIDSAVFLLPSIVLRRELGWLPTPMLDLGLFVLATLSHLLFFLVGQRLLHGRIGRGWLQVPALLATAVGLALNNGRAVLEGFAARAGSFVRTPKLGAHALRNQGVAARPSAYRQTLTGLESLELLLAALFAAYSVWACTAGLLLVAPFLLLFMSGFLYAGGQSLRERRPARAAAVVAAT